MTFGKFAFLLPLLAALGLQAAPVSPDLAPPTVGLMVKFDHKPSPGFLKSLQSEVGAIFRPSRLDLRWEMLQPHRSPGVYNRVAVIEMHGTCAPGADSGSSQISTRLGWTNVSDGEVQPYITIDCDNIAQVLASTWNHSASRHLAPPLYARLTARVMAHELIHVLLRTSEHHDSDCLRSPLRSLDLAFQPRLSNPEITALQRIGRERGAALAAAR
jgi:hypothetical protein